MFLIFNIIIFVLWIMLLTTINGKEEFHKDLTLHSIHGRLELNKSSIMDCSTKDSDFDKIIFFRPHFSGFDDGLPEHQRLLQRGSPFFDSLLFMPDIDAFSRFGPFQCEITKKSESEIITTNVITLKLPPSDLAELEAVSPYILVDSFVGGYVLEIRVKKAFPLPIKWRRNGQEIKEWTGLTKVVENIIISPGIYEAYYEGRRHLAVHAIMRVVHGNPDGYGDGLSNPPCYNGGAHHDQYKVCICPPGFTGDKCEKACGANKFGLNCDKPCSLPQNDEDGDELCAGHFFCKPDPYTCSCATGFDGPDCIKRCDPGWYGADCKQQCHCIKGSEFCNRFTGACEGGCLAGWGGDSCQIRTCPSNRYGWYCEHDCACHNGAKCADDGSCFCVGEWLGRFCNSTEPRIISLEGVKGVVGQPINLTCTAVGVPPPMVEITKKHENSFEVKNPSYLGWRNFTQAIVELVPQTEGNYKFICTANNEFGYEYQFIDLMIEKPPIDEE